MRELASLILYVMLWNFLLDHLFRKVAWE
uniref:Uncharacterized protein n=1 Tax=Rhizophora mucronata TaxID=61149 RepID=A0A2P2NBK3_RHIMU